MPTFVLTEVKLPAFKLRYEVAVRAGRSEFIFEGQQFVTAYAKYVIEYAEAKFNKQQRKDNK